MTGEEHNFKISLSEFSCCIATNPFNLVLISFHTSNSAFLRWIDNWRQLFDRYYSIWDWSLDSAWWVSLVTLSYGCSSRCLLPSLWLLLCTFNVACHSKETLDLHDNALSGIIPSEVRAPHV